MKNAIFKIILILLSILFYGCGGDSEGSSSSFEESSNNPSFLSKDKVDLTKSEVANFKFKVVAVDANDVRYYIVGDDANMFNINEFTGELTFNLAKYEEKPVYKFIAIAEDVVGHKEIQNIFIALVDKENINQEIIESSDSRIQLSKDLVVYYPFEGNAKDSSENSNDANEYGQMSYVDGKIGKAARFNGRSAIDLSNLGLNNIFNNGNYSISLWYESNDKTSELFEFDDDKIRISREDTNELLINYHKHYDYHYETYINDGVFNHILMVVDIENRIGKTYFNGELVATENNIEIETIADKGFIGKEFHPFLEKDDYFMGLIDDFRIYKRVLNELEVKELYKLGKSFRKTQ